MEKLDMKKISINFACMNGGALIKFSISKEPSWKMWRGNEQKKNAVDEKYLTLHFIDLLKVFKSWRTSSTNLWICVSVENCHSSDQLRSQLN